MKARKSGGHGFSRTDRINEQIRRELADLLRSEVKDPQLAAALRLVTLTAVEVSADYAHAKVFYTLLGDETRAQDVAQGLARISGHLRRALGQRVRIHQIPALHFHFDASVGYGARLSKLIDDTVAADRASHPAETPVDSQDNEQS